MDLRHVLYYKGDPPSSNRKCFICLFGVGTPKFKAGTKTEEEYDSGKYTFVMLPYDSRGFLGVFDAIIAVKNVAAIDKGKPIQTRNDRMKNIISIIKDHLQSDYPEVVLLGFSHGSLLLYSALIQIEKDVSIGFEFLKKLRFYAVSPPTILPKDTLSYNNIGDIPAFLQIQYEKDSLYSNNTLLGILSGWALTNISKYFKEYFNAIEKNVNYDQSEPTFLPFYTDVMTNTVFLLSFVRNAALEYFYQTTDEKKKQYIFNYFAEEHKQYPHALPHYEIFLKHTRWTKPLHASIQFLYVILNKTEYTHLYEFVTKPIFQGGASIRIRILGRTRKVIKRGRWFYIKYKKTYITIEAAKKIENKLST